TFSVSDCPGFNVAGSVAPETEKPLPITLALLTVTGAVPVELKVKGCDTTVPMNTLPNPIELPPTAKAGVPVADDIVMTNVVDTPPAWAVMVANCVVVTLDIVAVNPALIAPGLT